MNEHENYCSLETAKLLKQAGFDWECDKGYDGKRNEELWVLLNFNLFNDKYSLPSLSVAQKWLREVKGIEVNVLCVYINLIKKYSYAAFEGKYNHEIIDDGFDTYEEALEAGIKKCLTLILEKE